MKTISLTQGKFAQVDDVDFDWLNQWKWYYLSSGYAARDVTINYKKTCILMHTVLAVALGFSSPDHKNRDRLDNRRSNLRPASRFQQLQNTRRRSDNTSGYKGVWWNASRNRWTVRLQFEGKLIWGGSFLSKEEAALSYDRLAKKFFGEFASINFSKEAQT